MGLTSKLAQKILSLSMRQPNQGSARGKLATEESGGDGGTMPEISKRSRRRRIAFIQYMQAVIGEYAQSTLPRVTILPRSCLRKL